MQTVSVTGSGTAYDPWVVTFIDPGAINIQDLGKKDFEGANFEEALSSTSTTTQGSAVASATHHEIQAFENRASRRHDTCTPQTDAGVPAPERSGMPSDAGGLLA